ncbi:ATP-binding protein [Pseudomonas sp. RTC3]|uniref:ATP-binding protein n=1 Tax=unclassified Pseudomonas TaxID=196821 RepID=UPI002AB518A6|nr:MULTISPECIES: ATP-binding protein [unclassified Pseudomonas]MEB0062435.1 ATP-binding protein [Pseudomonas sp. RTC3]MDY7565766.1 ATP-binding protein [Pseudomonas sp. 5C2]MEB0028723.1 ATP-binding protein [Pseudomonas sp. MH9.2]MEB0240440.1 ATP-binding protein [Pseudomonas sp. 5C2]WPX70326.1 ATP-binding protein [Pseudomonas sp. MH9.2]
MDGFKKRLNDSVQMHLSVTLSLAILIVAVLAGFFAFVSAINETHEMQDETLRQVAILFDRQKMTFHYPVVEQVVGDDEESRVIVQYLTDSSKATGSDDATTPLPFPVRLADGLSTLSVAGENFRVLVRTMVGGERIVVAQEADVREKEARKSAWRSLLPFLILFPVLLLVVSDLVRKLFRPIATLSDEIDQRDEQALHPIDDNHLPTEIRPFVVAINRLLTRVAQSMEAQRRFIADAAHELRSPMTALSLQAERLSAIEMSAAAYERFLPLSRGIERSRKLIDQLLALAAAQSSSDRSQTSVSVHEVYRRVLEDLLPLAERKRIDIGVESIEDVQVNINAMDLLILVKNLVDNAIRYTSVGGRVDLTVELAQETVILQVKDSGPGISAEEQMLVFDPFYRSLGTDEAGSGLGLSIVKAIADRAGAHIRLSFSDEMKKSGLCVSVCFKRPEFNT